MAEVSDGESDEEDEGDEEEDDDDETIDQPMEEDAEGVNVEEA
jgi:hypothetical protein